MYALEHVKLMDRHYGGGVLHESSGLFSLFDGAFTSCTNGTNGITLFGLMSYRPTTIPCWLVSWAYIQVICTLLLAYHEALFEVVIEGSRL